MVWRTTIITCTTCFLLGTTFTHWIADHNVLWRSPLTSEALAESIRYYALLGTGAPALGWVYVAVGVAALVAAGWKLHSGWGKGGEVLFDGASLLLVASVTYNQITEVYPTLTSFPSPLPADLTEHDLFPSLGNAVRDLANDNIITAVMLTGVMLLQAGRYYSSKGSGETYPRSDTSADTSAASSVTASPGGTPGDEEPRTLSPVSGRQRTPFRELTEAEAMELNDSDTAPPKNVNPSPTKSRRRRK